MSEPSNPLNDRECQGLEDHLAEGILNGYTIQDKAGKIYGTLENNGMVMFREALEGSKIRFPVEEIKKIDLKDGVAIVVLHSGEVRKYKGIEENDDYSIADPVPIPTFSGQYNEFCIMADYYCKDYKMKLNILQEQVLMDPSPWRSDKSGFIPLTEADRWDAYENALNRLPRGIFESSGRERVMKHPILHFDKWCLSRAARNQVNPFVEEWRPAPNMGLNVISRFDPRYFLERCGAVSPIPDMDPEDNAALVRGLSGMTFQTIIGRMVEPEGAPGEIALYLFGEPGSGKSSISKALALGCGDEPGPYHRNFTEYPRDEISLYYATKGAVIVELEEGTGMGSQSMFNRLKGEITRHDFHVTGKWEIYNQPHPKRYTETITTNNYRGVPEDNRRICPLEVKRPENASDHAYVFPTEDMRAIYWNAWKGTGMDGYTSYEKGGRAHDIYVGIRNLIDRARRITVQVPEAWEEVEDFAEAYMNVPGRMASNKEIREYLTRQGHTVKDVDSAISWLKDGGYKQFGWERMESTGRNTQSGSYAREEMGRLHQKMNYKVPGI